MPILSWTPGPAAGDSVTDWLETFQDYLISKNYEVAGNTAGYLANAAHFNTWFNKQPDDPFYYGFEDPAATMADVRGSAGVVHTRYWASREGDSSVWQVEHTEFDNFLWRRKRYREILGVDADQDRDGNGAAIGHRAFLTVGASLAGGPTQLSVLGPPVWIEPVTGVAYNVNGVRPVIGDNTDPYSGPPFRSGMVYECVDVSPASWEYDPQGGLPDEISNALSPPFALAEASRYETFGSFEHGRCHWGDIIDVDLLSEIHAMLSMMVTLP
jgi:hypothetical protein